MKLQLLDQDFSVCRLDPLSEFPIWALNARPAHISISDDEISVICPTHEVPDDVPAADGGWSCFRVEGPLEFEMIGVLSSLLSPLADDQISILAVSTFNTDYVLVKEERLEDAKEILESRGHKFQKISFS